MGRQVVKRAYKYRFYPTDQQVHELNKTFGCVRYVYNRALEERSTAWTQDKHRVTYAETDRRLTVWRNSTDTSWLGETASVPQQQALRHLQNAFTAFWTKKSRYPTFKSKRHSKASAVYVGTAIKWRNDELRLAKMSDPLSIVWSRPLPEGSTPSSVTVSRDTAGRWYVSLLCTAVVHTHPPVQQTVGIDAGLTSLYTLSTGEKIANPRHEKQDRMKLARAQRGMARKENGSKNRERARLKVARVHAHIADRRHDHLHKLSTRLIRENQTVMIEDLSVRSMVRNHRLARAISDASWSEFRRQLEYKANWYGRKVIAIDRWYPSSKTCSACGAIVEKLPLNIREWTCRCGAVHDRDVNAAKNIRAVGLAVLACGDGVRPPRAKAREGNRH